jgi:5-formyltetrahydrofolate cyclo-ligase
MEEQPKTKLEIRDDITNIIDTFSSIKLATKTGEIENRLFGFANFLEANIVLLYANKDYEVPTRDMLKKCLTFNKILVLPAFDTEKTLMTPMKVDNPDTDLKTGPRNNLEPDPNRCRIVPIESIDIAIIPGIVFDEKGGRIGSGEGYYDRFMPKLSVTTRKVALAFESQILPQVPIESHDKHVDIIISEKRVIYKI